MSDEVLVDVADGIMVVTLNRPKALHALNDVVIHKPGAARVTPIHLAVGEGDDLEEIGSFSADGVIVATPTGSTA